MNVATQQRNTNCLNLNILNMNDRFDVYFCKYTTPLKYSNGPKVYAGP